MNRKNARSEDHSDDPVPVAALVRHALDGDHEAWDQIVERYEDLVWAVVRSFGLGHTDSLDAAQMVWLRLVESLDQIRDPDRLGAWLVTTTRRECLKVIDGSRRATPVDPVVAFSSVMVDRDPLNEVLTTDQIEGILRAFGQLPERCQALLQVMLVDPPPSYEEVAIALNLPIGTIGPRRQRCLRWLRAALSA